jgi:hypothetical protein
MRQSSERNMEEERRKTGKGGRERRGRETRRE